MSEYKAPIAIHPGVTLKEILDSTGMGQAELSRRTGLHTKTINEIIKGKKPISPTTALKLSLVFGMTENFWNNLQKNYDETVKRLELENELEKNKDLSVKFTAYNDLAKIGALPKTRDRKEKAKNLLKFFGVASFVYLDNLYSLENYAFRKNTTGELSKENLLLWLRLGEIEANKIETKPFDAGKLKDSLQEIKELNLLNPRVYSVKLIEKLSECGVALVFLPYLKNTFVNGASKWMRKDKAAIFLTPRNSWEDILWFTLFHELGHILKHRKKAEFISFWDERLIVQSEYRQLEEEADKFASDILIEKNMWRRFFQKNNFTQSEIIKFSKQVSVNPGIVAGRLAKQTGDWAKFRRFRDQVILK